MSWILNRPLTFLEYILVNIIKCGPIPKHIAFIMDGNRRYAAKTNVLKAEGHSQGFNKLADTLEWCRKLGVMEVTVYAFSIENFKRSADEVDTLMQLAREKFAQLLNERDKLMEQGVCIRVIGKLSLLPDDIRASIVETMLLTKDNKSAFLNIAFAYTSRDEIANSIITIVNGVNENRICVDDIDSKLITQCLYSNHSPVPDILVRTSGEVRLSDFLLWQISSTKLHFTNILWPEFSIWHLLYAVFLYQRNYNELTTLRNNQLKLLENNCINCNENRLKFLKHVETERLKYLELNRNNIVNS